MQFERYNGVASTEMETPYGVAKLELTHEGGKLNVWVRDGGGKLVARTDYFKGTDQSFHRETAKGVRSASWGLSVVKKARHDMLVVLDALVTAWVAKHSDDLKLAKVATLRARAWNMQRTANEYAKMAADLAEAAERVAA